MGTVGKAPWPRIVKLPPLPVWLSGLPGAGGHSENQTHHGETLNFADARHTDKLAESITWSLQGEPSKAY